MLNSKFSNEKFTWISIFLRIIPHTFSPAKQTDSDFSKLKTKDENKIFC